MRVETAITHINFLFPTEKEYGGVTYLLTTIVDVNDNFTLITIAYLDDDMKITTVGSVALDEDFQENVKNLLDIFDYKL